MEEKTITSQTAKAVGRTRKKSKEPRGTRRNQIIEVASRIFQEKGYKAASLEDVASELHISRPAIYHHVESKEEILREIYQKATIRLTDGLSEFITMEMPLEEKLNRIIHHHVLAVLRNRDLVAIFFHEGNSLPKRYATRTKRKQREYHKAIEAVIQEGVEKGVFRDVHPTMTTYAIMGMCNWAYQWYSPDGPLSAEEISDIFADLICNGYIAR